MIHAEAAMPGRPGPGLGFRVSFASPRALQYRFGSLNPTDVKRLIEQGMPSAKVVVESDDNTHFEALVVSAEFEGKRALARHQMVYAALGPAMGREIHALSLRTLTPAEHGNG